VQAHPEFTSKVLEPSPAYLGFVAASCDKAEETHKTTNHNSSSSSGHGCLAKMIEAARLKKEGLVNGVVDASHF
jgi:CTP synthase